MMSVIGWIVFGLIVGVVGKLLMPGKDPGGFLATVAIGIIGALFGGMLGRMIGMYGQDDPVGFVMAPMTAITNPTGSSCPYMPIIRPSIPPKSAPMMPMATVARNPPGSFPGIKSFPTTPTINPKTIQPMTLIIQPSYLMIGFTGSCVCP